MRRLSSFFLFVILSVPSWAQEISLERVEIDRVLNSESINWEEDIQYIMQMSPEEFGKLQQRGDFDESKLSQVYRNSDTYLFEEKLFQDTRNERVNFKTTIASAESDCWVEPDETYTEIMWWELFPTFYPSTNHFSNEIPLGWDFCLFGQTFNKMTVNEKGTISFEPRYRYWWKEPRELNDPALNGDEWATSGPGYNHVCGFWEQADMYYTHGGRIFYKVEDDRAYINFVNMAYYSYGSPSKKRNTFQIMIVKDDSQLEGQGNVQFCYRDMQWAESIRTSTNGCDGSRAYRHQAGGIVGASAKHNEKDHVQVGRFGSCGDFYKGAYGTGVGSENGVDWLDYREIVIDACSQQDENKYPLSSYANRKDTVKICLGNTKEFDIYFMGPELDQTLDVVYDNTREEIVELINTTGSQGTARVKFEFTGKTAGIHDIFLTATDNGVGSLSTSRRITIEVVNDNIPVPSIAGTLSVCKGGESVLRVVPNDFDSYFWSNGATGNSAVVDDEGIIEVRCVKHGCSEVTSVEMEIGEFFNPKLASGTGNKACPNVPLTLSTEDEYQSYSWDFDPDVSSKIYSESMDQATLDVGPGLYTLTVEDDLGCEGQATYRIFAENAYLPPVDLWSGNYCDTLQEIQFSGGYSSPASGNVIFTMTTDQDGWGGAYIEVGLKRAGYSFFTTYRYTIGEGGMAQEALDIQYGDSLRVVYYGSYTGNGLSISSCGFPVNDLPALENEALIYYGSSQCDIQELSVNWWQKSGPSDGVFSDNSVFNSSFTPTEYGVYEVCAEEGLCSLDPCYELVFNKAPAIELDIEDIRLCTGDKVFVNADTTDIGQSGIVTWNIIGKETTDGVQRKIGPFPGCVVDYAIATIDNGCGVAADTAYIFAENSLIEPQLEDYVACDLTGASFSPYAAADQCESYNFLWLFEGDTLDHKLSSLADLQSGSYSVIIDGFCNETVQLDAKVVIIDSVAVSIPSQTTECGPVAANLCFDQELPENYVLEWSTGEDLDCIEVPNNGSSVNVSVRVTDVGNCFEREYDVEVLFTEEPTKDPMPMEFQTVCEGSCAEFILGSTQAIDYTWSLKKGTTTHPLSETGDVLTLCAEDIPAGFLNSSFTVEVIASNPCGSVSHSFESEHRTCELGYHNVFTPNGDGFNDYFVISDIHNFTAVYLRVVNRWGVVVYENEAYDNSWDGTLSNGEELEAGTYFYTVELDDGESHSGSFNILRD